MQERSNIPNLVDSTPTALIRNRPSSTSVPPWTHRARRRGHRSDGSEGGPTTLEMPMFKAPPAPVPRLPWVVGAMGLVGLAARCALFWYSTRTRPCCSRRRSRAAGAPTIVATPAPEPHLVTPEPRTRRPRASTRPRRWRSWRSSIRRS
jgi:hypothetical protein